MAFKPRYSSFFFFTVFLSEEELVRINLEKEELSFFLVPSPTKHIPVLRIDCVRVLPLSFLCGPKNKGGYPPALPPVSCARSF